MRGSGVLDGRGHCQACCPEAGLTRGLRRSGEGTWSVEAELDSAAVRMWVNPTFLIAALSDLPEQVRRVVNHVKASGPLRIKAADGNCDRFSRLVMPVLFPR